MDQNSTGKTIVPDRTDPGPRIGVEYQGQQHYQAIKARGGERALTALQERDATKRRLDRARELLLDGRLSVTDVSRAVGYSSASHFIKEFRSRFGTTPRAYVDAQALGDQMAALRQA
jgi:AraC-like DNA-binding protein